MAAGTHSPYHDRRLVERRRMDFAPMLATGEGLRVSWGGIWGGVLSAIGLLILLSALGMAVGITAVKPGETDAATLGTGTGLWAGVSLLLALFLGGLVATRTGAIFDRTTGFFEGALVWVVSVLLMGYLATTGIGVVAGGAFRMVGGASEAIGAVVQGSSGGEMTDFSGTPAQILGKLKDPKTAQQVAAATGMPQSQVQASLNETAQRVESARDNPKQAAAEARDGLKNLYERAKSSGTLERKAAEMKPQAARAAWITFGALVLSLLAAVLGAMAGRRRLPIEHRRTEPR
ncbi:MAG: hypothetical protein ACT4P4_24285 [Betaproteobacteria bacterium]